MGGLGTDDDQAAVDRVRLHITPFNPELFERILAPSLRPLASNVSFHTEQTYPDRGFGYVDLPVMEAQKLKTKLNGSTLKGAKVRIEDAKPERKRKADKDAEDEGEAEKPQKLTKKERRKQERGVISGHELEDGRRVKRGWTDDDGKESRKIKKGSEKSERGGEGTDGPRLRFKATIPPNAEALVEESKKKKKKKDGGEGNDKKKTTIVQEFTKTKKSRDVNMGAASARHGTLSYKDGAGWVDESGSVVEAERTSKNPRRSSRLEVQSPDRPVHKDETLEEAAPEEPSIEDDAVPADVPQESATPSKEVHPLEALFKRPTSSASESSKRKPKPIDTSFSFFDANAAEEADDVDEMHIDLPPQTPHTKRDLEWRSLRSAAPTPDTAALGRKLSFPFASQEDEDGDEDEDEDMDMQEAAAAEAGAAPDDGEGRGEESAFRKWFYDNRGDFNRGWKKRRRDERKQKRQRENKRLGQKMA